MLSDFREIWRYRELLFLLVRRDLKVRYKNSILGFGWSFLNPLVQVLVITLVLQFLWGGGAKSYHAYVLCATLPWLFFSTAIMDSCASLPAYFSLIRRIYFPREIIQLAVIIANLVHFLMALAVFIVYMGANWLFWQVMGDRGSFPLLPTLLLVPIPILGLTLLVTGLSMFLSVWALYYEDVRFIADNGLKVLYWLVPVVYFADLILFRDPWSRGKLVYTLYMLNPLACYVSVFRKLALPPTQIPSGGDRVLITAGMTPEDWGFLGIALILSALLAYAGQRYFSSRKWKLAERP